MMGFDSSIFLMLYGVLSVVTVVKILRNWSGTWDLRFTHEDKSLIDQAAFFVLMPIAVILHELGHAVAIWLMGGQVLDYGYYGFAGWVSYDPSEFSEAQQILIASAGTLVNIGLAAIALAVVFLRKPPMRAAFNELLIQFVYVSLLNALILYPLLDFTSGMNGDWRQMYFGGEPAISGLILILHVGIVVGLLWAYRDSRVKQRVAQLTATVASPRQRQMMRPMESTNPNGGFVSPDHQRLQRAAQRVAGGWSSPVTVLGQPAPDGALVGLRWQSGTTTQSVIARVVHGTVSIVGENAPAGQSPTRYVIQPDTPLPSEDELTLMLRLAMEEVDRRAPLSAGA